MDKHILIIDDDARNIFALTAVLKAMGYQCISALAAEEGLQLLATQPNIGLVLLDIMMPDMDGYQAIAHIRGNPATTGMVVFAVTAQAMIGDREKCLEAGANEYISKPIDVDILTALLQKYL
ncbi:response regulator [Deminuibacter soli]|uniref:Response regulator n=1 Tax=Deminuibacter soli TaxID=2291815 RepID=A0A3E1NIP7_9BACT|nr:response regulator [Deminuibacter soli]RFM27751.1 response regulator [Deminuibacter soli]